ncbi:hypothetical protein ACIFOE_22325 [Paenibacillus sp. NRS-1783]|uniref:hypothetical protein n=1 Tax=Paenibacillus sp. NRS-1783 TaxID=3233907 RepID=UPI003D29A644
MYMTRDGTVLTADDQETLWFLATRPTGKYQFKIKTANGSMYAPVLNWVKP